MQRQYVAKVFVVFTVVVQGKNLYSDRIFRNRGLKNVELENCDTLTYTGGHMETTH